MTRGEREMVISTHSLVVRQQVSDAHLPNATPATAGSCGDTTQPLNLLLLRPLLLLLLLL